MKGSVSPSLLPPPYFLLYCSLRRYVVVEGERGGREEELGAGVL